MMKKFLKFNFCVITLLFIIQSLCAQNKISSKLSEHLISIEPANADYSFLKKSLANNLLISLGETSHGIHESSKSRFEIIKYLCSELNYKTIFLEIEDETTILLNDYINSKPSEKNKALHTLAYWIWHNQDFMDLVDWIKLYNLSVDSTKKVSFVGVDMNMPLNTIKKVLSVNNNLSPKAQSVLREILSDIFLSKIENKSEKFSDLIRELKAKENYNNIIVAQYLQQQLMKSIDGNGFRDSCMAKNIEYKIKEYKSKSIFLAHNEHIANTNRLIGCPSTGKILKEKLGNEYYSLGYDFGKGSFFAMNTDEKPAKLKVFSFNSKLNKNCYEYYFLELGQSPFFIDTKQAMKDEELAAFLSQKRFWHIIGATFGKKYNTMKTYKSLNELYDGLIFFPEVTAAKMVDFKTQ